MTDGEPETVVSASLQKIKLIKPPSFFFSFFFFIKSETSDSFVNHFDGHFAYLKTLDFYFNNLRTICIPSHSCLEANSFTILKQTSLQQSPAKLYCEWVVFRRPSRGYPAVTKGYSQKDASLQVRLFLSSHLMSLPAILQSLVQHGKLNSLQNHNTCHHHFYWFTSHAVLHTSFAQNQLSTTYQLVIRF